MVRLAAILLGMLAFAACSSGSDKTASPSVTPTAAPSIVATASTTDAPSPAASFRDFFFRGIVREVNNSCAVDGLCSVTVEVTDGRSSGLEDGQRVKVTQSYGFSIWQCLGEWDSAVQIRQIVEVRAHTETRPIEDPDLSICEDDSYYVRTIALP